MTTREAPFGVVFAHALRGEPCRVLGLGPVPTPLPVADWSRPPDRGDAALLALCVGATLDVGCGPGRLTADLAAAGHVALGIDVVHEAVDQTRGRGASALLRDVFEQVPGEGRWQTALLADGNIGIGGDPVALLARVRDVLDPRGRVVVELAAPGVSTTTCWARLECAGTRSRPFRWSVVGVDGIGEAAAAAGLAVTDRVPLGRDRWAGVLEEDVA